MSLLRMVMSSMIPWPFTTLLATEQHGRLDGGEVQQHRCLMVPLVLSVGYDNYILFFAG